LRFFIASFSWDSSFSSSVVGSMVIEDEDDVGLSVVVLVLTDVGAPVAASSASSAFSSSSSFPAAIIHHLNTIAIFY
jgi:hypothetical protein